MYAVVDDLEESPGFCRVLDLLDDFGTVGVGKVDDWDGGVGGGFEIGEGVRRVEEDGRDGGDAGIGEALHSHLGFVELLHRLCSVVPGGRHL